VVGDGPMGTRGASAGHLNPPTKGWCTSELGGRPVVEALARPLVQFCGDSVEVRLVPLPQVGRLRKVLTSSLLVFSFVPRCQGLCGSAK